MKVIKDNLYWIIAFMLGAVLVFTVFGDKGLLDLQRLRREQQQLVEQNARLKSENRTLYRSVERLKGDPAYIEQVAREELGMIKKDEYVMKFRK